MNYLSKISKFIGGSPFALVILLLLVFFFSIFDRNFFGLLYIYIDRYVIVIVLVILMFFLFLSARKGTPIYLLFLLLFVVIESNNSLVYFVEKGSQNVGLASRGDSVLALPEDVDMLKNWNDFVGVPVVIDAGNVVMFGRLCENNYETSRFLDIQKYYGISKLLFIMCTQNEYNNGEKGAIFTVESVKNLYKVIEVRSDLFGFVGGA